MPARLAVSGSYLWTGGTQSGTGVTRIAPGGTLERSGTGNALSLDARTLRIEGTGLVTSTNVTAISASGSARIEVASGGILDLRSSSDIAGGAGGRLVIEPGGTLTKTQVGNLAVGIELENQGMIDAAAGILDVTGTFLNWSAETKTLTGGAYVVTATLRFTGADIVTNAADIELDGAASAFLNTSGLRTHFRLSSGVGGSRRGSRRGRGGPGASRPVARSERAAA